MFGPSITHGFRVAPRSILEIRRHAAHVRQVFGIAQDFGFFPMEEFIESWTDWGITYDVLDRGEMPDGVEACCVPERALIQFSSETYAGACMDAPRARFTVVHELGHLALSHTRAFHRERRSTEPIKAYEDSEWQANRFAAEFLMPADDIRRKGFRTSAELVLHYQVSSPAATRRIEELRKQSLI